MKAVFICITVFICLAGTCSAKPGDDGMGGLKQRDVSATSDGTNGIVVQSLLHTDTTNKVTIQIRTTANQAGNNQGSANGKRLTANIKAFTHFKATAGANNVAHLDFRAKFQQLLEYLEQDGVPGFSGNDTVGTSLYLGDQNYVYAGPFTQGTLANPIVVTTATSTYFTITCSVGSLLWNNSNVWTFTNSAKIDVDIQNFPYALGGNARLALVMGMVSLTTQSKSVETDPNQPSTSSSAVVVRETSGGAQDAYFSWSETVTVTSPTATANVIAGPLTVAALDADDDLGDHRNIVYSFDALRPSTVHWDPVFAVSASRAFIIVPSIAVLIFLFVALLF